jgi:hypothetical protein
MILAALQIAALSDEMIPALQRFNERIRNAVAPELLFPIAASDYDFGLDPSNDLHHAPYVAIGDGGEVHGAYYLTHERYWLSGREVAVAHYRHPISEVLIDKRFKGLSTQLLSDALRRNPRLYSTIGTSTGTTGAMQVLKKQRSEGWSDCSVPFFFRVHNVSRFLDNIAPLRSDSRLRAIAQVARVSRAGHAITLAQRLRTKGFRVESKMVQSFGSWSDRIWGEAREHIRYCQVRDAKALNARYTQRRNFVRIQVGDIGWAVVLITPMQNHAYFGSMTVGTLVDALARPGSEAQVVRAAADHLAGADLWIANFSLSAWTAALSANGWWSRPTNFIVTFSPVLAGEIGDVERIKGECHFTRSEGAGISRL